MKRPDFKKDHPLKIFLSYYRPHMRLFTLDMVCALLICIIDLAFPYISKISMERLIPELKFGTFFVVMGICAAAYILKGVFYYVVSYWGHVFGVHVESDIRRDIFTHMQTLSFGYYDVNRTGQLMSRVMNDLFEITELAHHGPEDIFISSVTLIGALAIMFTIEWRLALILCIILPFLICFVILQRGRMRRANIKVKAKTAEINAAIESSISGMRTSKAFGNEAAENTKFSDANNQLIGAKAGFYRQMAIFHGSSEMATSIISVAVIAAGGFFIMRGTLDYIGLVTFTLYTSTFISPIKRLIAFVEQFIQGSAGFSRFLEVMRTEPDIKDSPDAEDLGDVKGAISFEDVSFSYSEGNPVLKNVSLDIKAGTKVAFVGPSGGGKTTLCQLVPRFYDVTGGRVTVDGHDVRSVTQKSLRRNIGVVQQDVFLFAGSILENIRYGRPEATDAEVREAARLAEIHADILQMPNGYDTYVGERGVMLSGGQKQRISIARVFLKNPPVVILDEATSALDSITEARIQASFDRLCAGRTSIIIAHRLSTVRNADSIAVVDGERILEYGTHDELMALGGEYANLVNAQEHLK